MFGHSVLPADDLIRIKLLYLPLQLGSNCSHLLFQVNLALFELDVLIREYFILVGSRVTPIWNKPINFRIPVVMMMH